MSAVVKIESKFKLHQTVYDSVLEVQAHALGVGPGSWVWEAVEHEGDRSRIRRVMKSEITPVINVLRGVSDNITWHALASKSFDELKMRDVVAMFELLETHIGAANFSGNVKHSFSLRTRALLLRYLLDRGFAKIERISAFFASRLPLDRGQHRLLIGDEADTDVDGPLEPLGATSHANIPDLKQKMYERIANPLRRIAEACSAELMRYEAAYAAILEIVDEPYNKSVLKSLANYHLGGANAAQVREIEESMSSAAVAHAYLQLFLGKSALRQPPRVKRILHKAGINEYLSKRLGANCLIPCDHIPRRSWPLFRARDVLRGVIESFQREQMQ